MHVTGEVFADNQGDYGTGDVGGIVGTLGGDATNSSADVDVHAPTARVGGIAGSVIGEIHGSEARGDVTGDNRVGGLIGSMEGTTVSEIYVSDSEAYGDVTGDDRVGGLVGQILTGNVTGSEAHGDVTGDDRVGGFTGYVEVYSLGIVEVMESEAHGHVILSEDDPEKHPADAGNTGGFIGSVQNDDPDLEPGDDGGLDLNTSSSTGDIYVFVDDDAVFADGVGEFIGSDFDGDPVDDGGSGTITFNYSDDSEDETDDSDDSDDGSDDSDEVLGSGTGDSNDADSVLIVGAVLMLVVAGGVLATRP